MKKQFMRITKAHNTKHRIMITTIFSLFSLLIYADNYVYVCTGEGAYKYHYSDECFLLHKCQAEIIMITESEAIKDPKYKGLCANCQKKYSPKACPDKSSLKETVKQEDPPLKKNNSDKKIKSKKIDIGEFKKKNR